MDFMKRLITILKSNANYIVNDFENPAKMAEQCIRDLKNDLQKLLIDSAEINAMKTSIDKKIKLNYDNAVDSEEKAVFLLNEAKKRNSIDSDVLEKARICLKRKNMCLGEAEKLKEQSRELDDNIFKIDSNISNIRNVVSESELRLINIQSMTRSSYSRRVRKLNNNVVF